MERFPLTYRGSDPPDETATEAVIRRQRALLEFAERDAGIGSWEWIPDTGELVWSNNAFRLIGLEPGKAPPSTELVLDLTHPDDRERQAAEVERISSGGGHQHFDYRIVLPDGAIRRLRSTIVVIEETLDRPRRVIGTIQDLSQQLLLERTMAIRAAVSEALLEWDSVERGSLRLLERLGEAMGFEIGAFWLPRGEVLACSAFWSSSSVDASEFETRTRELQLPPGAGLIGRAWQGQEPVLVTNLRDEGVFYRRDTAQRLGLRGAVVFPPLHRDKALAVLEFYSCDEVDETAQLGCSLVRISHELGCFLADRRGQLTTSPLTPREQEVLQLVAAGLTGPMIAERLGLSPATVRTHVKHLHAKLGATSNASAVAAAIRAGLIE